MLILNSLFKNFFTYIFSIVLTSGGTQVTSTTSVKITANQTLYARWSIKNEAPVISSSSLKDKETNSFIVKAQATDAENDKLTYKLYVSTNENNNFVLKKTLTQVTQNTEVSLNADGLEEFKDYWWYIEVSDPYNTILSDKKTLKTYCSGGGTCYASICKTNATTCAYCVNGQIQCNNASCKETGSGFIPASCSVCGAMYQMQRASYSCSACGHAGYTLITYHCEPSTTEGSLSVPHSGGSCNQCDGGYVYSGKCSEHNLSAKHYYCTKHSYVSTTTSAHIYECSHGITGKHD